MVVQDNSNSAGKALSTPPLQAQEQALRFRSSTPLGLNTFTQPLTLRRRLALYTPPALDPTTQRSTTIILFNLIQVGVSEGASSATGHVFALEETARGSGGLCS